MCPPIHHQRRYVNSVAGLNRHSFIRDQYDQIYPRTALLMKPPWQHTRITAVGPLLLALALVGAACGGTATPDNPSPAGVESKPEATGSATATGHEVGQLAPDFVLTSDEGQQFTMASLRNENRPVVLYFFTTW